MRQTVFSKPRVCSHCYYAATAAAAAAAAVAATAAAAAATAAAAAAGTGVEALLSPVEAAMVDELNAELRQTLRDYRCVSGPREVCHRDLL